MGKEKLAYVILNEIEAREKGRSMTPLEETQLKEYIRDVFVDERHCSMSIHFKPSIKVISWCNEYGKDREVNAPRELYGHIKEYLTDNHFVVKDMITNEQLINRELLIRLPKS